LKAVVQRAHAPTLCAASLVVALAACQLELLVPVNFHVGVLLLLLKAVLCTKKAVTL